MKRVNWKSAILALAALAMPAMSDAAYAAPSGASGGKALWNANETGFMYPPSFGFAGSAAASYRYTLIDDRHGRHVFYGATPQEPLDPVWPEIPAGMCTLVVEGVDPQTNSAGVVGTRTFWKRAGFDASGCPPAARPYREAALMAYDFIFQSPGARHLLATGETDPKCRVNAYPTKMMSAMIEAMLRYARLRPETKGEALQIARAAADYLIAHSEKPGSPLASCPPTYETRPELKVTAAKTYEGQMMMIYPADAGSAYLKLAGATGDGGYRNAAVAIAETYLRLQGEDGTWPLMMFLDDGRPNGSHRLIPTVVAAFLLEVADATGEGKYREAASRAFAYIENGPCRTFDWSAQFEDVGVKAAPYSNLTKDEAVDFARHILKAFPGDAAKAEEARKLLEFGENLFVYWERPVRADGAFIPNSEDPSGQYPEWTVFPCVGEQHNYNVPVDASAAKMIEGYLAFYKATKDPVDLAKAKALGDSITRAQFEFGDIPTVWTRRWIEKQRNERRGGWLNCTVAAALALEHIADAAEDCQLQERRK